MGRKSKAKKIIREMLKEKENKKHAPNGKNKKNSSKEKIIQKLNRNRYTLLSAIVTLLTLGLIIFIGFFLFEKAFLAKPLSKLLPKNQTIAFVEINTNFDHSQVIKALKLLSVEPEYTQEKIIEKIHQKFSIDFENDIKPWLGRQIGYAILNSPKDKSIIESLYFAEFRDKKNFQNFLNRLESTTTQLYGKNTIYKTSKALFISTVDSYMVASFDEQSLRSLLDFQNSKAAKLSSADSYQKINTNLPLNKTAFFYINFHQISDALFKTYPFLSEKGLSMEIIGPFLNLLDSEGMALVSMDDNFAVQSFLNFSKQIINSGQHLSFQGKYNARLTAFMPANTLFFWGAENLANQLKRMLDILSVGNQSTLEVFDKLIQNYTERYFGQDTSFKQDVLPLLNKEFAFVVENFENKPAYKVLIELDNRQQDALLLEQLANNFASEGAVFAPKIVERILPDGTVSKEIIAIPEQIEKSEINYGNHQISRLKVGQQGWGIYYGVFDNMAVICTSLEGVKNTIDLMENKGTSLKQSPLFKSQIEPIIRSSDEITYFNFPGFIGTFLKGSNLPDFIDIIETGSFGRNYFNDGIVTINFIHLSPAAATYPIQQPVFQPFEKHIIR